MNKIQPHHLYSTPPISRIDTEQNGTNRGTNQQFQEILTQKLGDSSTIKVSKHATQRLAERNISIDPKEWQLITQKVKEAGQKGITDSVVITKNAALLVNAKNNTVITAVNRKDASGQIFTNINGTIILD